MTTSCHFFQMDDYWLQCFEAWFVRKLRDNQ